MSWLINLSIWYRIYHVIYVWIYENRVTKEIKPFFLKSRRYKAQIRFSSIMSVILWPAPWAHKMNQILHCDWLPKRARWSYLACLGLLVASHKKSFLKSHTLNFLLTKFVRSRWLDIGLILFWVFIDLDSVLVHKHAKKELGQYPAILTEHLVNSPYQKHIT